MGCLKGKKKSKPEKGAYRCTKCGGVSKDKDDICKPKKISGKKKEKKKDKD